MFITSFLVAVFTIGYYILRFIHRRTSTVNLPRVEPGQWDPIIANYTWSTENQFKDEYIRVAQNPKSTPADLAKVLMRRAIHAVDLALEMQERRHTLQSLVRSGNVGEEIWARYENAERLLSEELEAIAMEAERLKPGWGQAIFPQARELLALEKKREAEAEQKRRDEELKEFQKWESERQKQEMKERDDAANRAAAAANPAPDAGLPKGD